MGLASYLSYVLVQRWSADTPLERGGLALIGASCIGLSICLFHLSDTDLRRPIGMGLGGVALVAAAALVTVRLDARSIRRRRRRR